MTATATLTRQERNTQWKREWRAGKTGSTQAVWRAQDASLARSRALRAIAKKYPGVYKQYKEDYGTEYEAQRALQRRYPGVFTRLHNTERMLVNLPPVGPTAIHIG